MAESSSNYKWAVVGMLWFICFFNYADRQAISSILPLLESEFGFNKTQQGWIVAAFMWVYALTAPFAGQVSDRFSRKYIILGGLYAWSIITGFTAGCTRLWQLVLVRGSEGLGETFYFPASMSLVSDYHGPATRSRAMSLHQTSVYAGTIGGGVLAGWLGEVFDWRVPFVLLGTLGVVLGLVLAKFIREPQRNEAERALAGGGEPVAVAETMPLGTFFGEMARTPTALLLVTAFFGANFVGMSFLSWMPTYFHETFELRLWVAALLATVLVQVPSMFGSIAGGHLADLWSMRTPGGRARVQALGLLCGVPFVYMCGMSGEARNLKLMIGATIAVGICKGLYDSNIWASLYDVIPPSRRSTAVGLTNMIGWFGAAIGTVAVGMLNDAGWSMSFIISAYALVYLLSGGLLLAASVVTAGADISRIRRETY
jgi:MFS family permease